MHHSDVGVMMAERSLEPGLGRGCTGQLPSQEAEMGGDEPKLEGGRKCLATSGQSRGRKQRKWLDFIAHTAYATRNPHLSILQ